MVDIHSEEYIIGQNIRKYRKRKGWSQKDLSDAVYEVNGAHTVMAVDRCGDCRYDFTDGTYQIIPAEEFENMEWSIRLLMEGERRMEHNRNKTSDKFENTALECDGSDWSAAVMVDFMDDCKAEVLADKELRRLYAAMSKLTERQMEIIQLYGAISIRNTVNTCSAVYMPVNAQDIVDEEFSKLDEDDYIEFQPDLTKITVTLEEMAPHTNARYGRNEIGMADGPSCRPCECAGQPGGVP